MTEVHRYKLSGDALLPETEFNNSLAIVGDLISVVPTLTPTGGELLLYLEWELFLFSFFKVLL